MELDYKNMQAGRELDAYVACKIFGYNNGKTDDKYFDFIKKLNKEILPPYSTDLNASWEVVNEITKNKHWTFKIRKLPGGDWIAHFKKQVKSGEIKEDVSSKPCKSACHAICEAALAYYELPFVAK